MSRSKKATLSHALYYCASAARIRPRPAEFSISLGRSDAPLPVQRVGVIAEWNHNIRARNEVAGDFVNAGFVVRF
jgi:hypothetical protein